MMKKLVLLLATALLLSGCFAGGLEKNAPKTPAEWSSYRAQNIEQVKAEDLKKWWENFNDPQINDLVAKTLLDSPDRLIAEARIKEARGLRRNARSFLFPQIGASASKGREKSAFTGPSDNTQAGFDASFELDIFGVNRKAAGAADNNLRALEYAYHDVSLTLVAETIRSYVEARGFEKQIRIAEKNLSIQKETLKLIKQQQEFGEAPQLDVERAESLVNTTRASIPEFKRLAQNSRLQLTVLTGLLPEELDTYFDKQTDIPGVSLEPIIASPAQVLALRPDIKAAAYALEAQTDIAESTTREIFPTLSLGGMFAYLDSGLASGTQIWSFSLSSAVALLDFGRIEGRIDAARAVEKQSYEQYRRTVLAAVAEVEIALNDFGRISEQRQSLKKAFDNANNALKLSQSLFKEGEISFLDVLDSQRTVNEADAAFINAEAAQVEALIRLYKSLGVY
ncbi:MAG: hypothetical protein CMH30_06165 [Micavibrio sp.]|nr:hypothetical protein [Micavibrio sp.]